MVLIIEKLHAAAFHLTKHPNATAQQIADYIGNGTSERTIQRWATLPEWQSALDNLGFTGDRSWRRKTHSGALVDIAKQTYERLRADGVPRHHLIRVTAKALDIPIPRLRNWVKRFGWNSHQEEATDADATKTEA